ncbi:MAG: hypothetical protein KGM99_08255 [Burkholderiales bacterium]|nr:hypothetical protein [Burkholderiales bacterium]
MAQFSTKAEPAVKTAVQWYTFNRVVAALFLLMAAALARQGALFFISVLLSVLVLTNGECKRKHRFADLLFGLGNALAVGACVLMASAVLTSANALARATVIGVAMLCALILLGSGFALLLLRLWPGAKD